MRASVLVFLSRQHCRWHDPPATTFRKHVGLLRNRFSAASITSTGFSRSRRDF